MADPLDDLPADEEFLPSVLRRRMPVEQAPTEVIDPYKGNWLAETTRSQYQRVANYGPALTGLARKLGGDDAGAQEAFSRFAEGEQKAQELGPEIQDFSQANSATDYASALGYQTAAFVPDMVLALTGAGLGAVGAKTAGGALARSALRKTVENQAKTQVLRETTERAAVEAAVKAGADDAAVRVARAQAREAVDKQVIDRVVKLSGRTPRSATGIELATKTGRVAGATAGQYPGMVSGDVDILSQEGTTQEDAAKVAGVTALASAAGVLPVERFFGKFGKQAVRDAMGQEVPKIAEKFLPRVAKEFAKQGLAEGSTEVLQEATQLAGHKWVDDNISLIDADARDRYLSSFLGGFFAGGALGASAEGARALPGAVKGVATSVKERLSTFAGKQRDAFRRKYRAGEQMDPEDTPDTGRRYIQVLHQLNNGYSDNTHLSNISAGDALAQRLKDVEAYASQLKDGRPFHVQQNEGPLPVDMPNRLQESLMRSLRPDNDWWQDPKAARQMGRTLEKVFRGEKMTSDDWINLHSLTSNKKSGISQAMIDFWAMTGPDYIAKSGEIETLLKEGEGAATSDEDTQETVFDENAVAQESLGAVNVGGLEGLSAVDKLANTDPKSPEYAELQAQAQADLRAGGFVKREGSEAEFNKRVAQPGYVALRDGNELLDLGAIIQRQRARSREQLTPTQHLKNAINDLKLAGMQINAATFTPGTIELKDGTTAELTANDVRELQRKPIARVETLPKDETELAREQEARRQAKQRALDNEALDAEDILAKQEARDLKEKEAGADLEPRRGAQAEAVVPPPGQSLPGREGFVPDQTGIAGVTVDPKPGLKALQVAGAARRANALSRLAKRLGVDPDQIVAVRTKKGTKSDTNDVFEGFVELRDGSSRQAVVPGHLVGYDRARNNKGVPIKKGSEPAGDRTDLRALPKDERFEHGIAVGEAELAKQFPESERNARTEKIYQDKLARLRDPATGVAMRYHERAVKGEFESGSVREQPWDTEEAEGFDQDYRPVDDAAPLRDGPQTKEPETAFLDPALEKKRKEAQQGQQTLNAAHGAAAFNAASDRNDPLDYAIQVGSANAAYDTLRSGFALAYGSGRPGPELEARIAKLMSSEEGKVQLLFQVGKIRSRAGYARVLGVLATNYPNARDTFVNVYASYMMHIRDIDAHGTAETRRTNSAPVGHEKLAAQVRAWREFDNAVAPMHGKSLKEALQAMLAAGNLTYAEQHMLQALIKAKALEGVGFEIAHGGYESPHFSPDRNVVRVPTEARLDSPASVMIHEAIHAMTLYAEVYSDSARQDVERLLKHVRSHAEMVGVPIDTWYGMSDTQEFLAEAFSNPEFQRILRKIPAANTATFRNAWEEFKGFILKLLGLSYDPKTASALEEALVLGTVLGKERADNPRYATPYAGPHGPPGASILAADRRINLNAPQGALPPPPNGGSNPKFDLTNVDSLIAYMRDIVPPEAKAHVMAVLDRADAHQAVKRYMQAVAEASGMDPQQLFDLMDDAKTGLEHTLAFGYLTWQADGFKGKFGQDVFHIVSDDLAAMAGIVSTADLAHRVFTDVASGRISTNKNYNARAIEERNRGQMQRIANVTRQVGEKISKPLSVFWDSKLKRMWDANVPALRELAALIQRPHGTTGEDPGMTPAIRTMAHQYQMRGAKILNGLSAREQVKLMDRLQRKMPMKNDGSAVDRAHEQVTRLMADAHKYMKDAGVDVGFRPDFFPVVFDIRNETVKTKLTELYSQPKFEQSIREVLGDPKDSSGQPVPIADLVKNLVDGVTGEPGPVTTGSNEPKFRGKNYRLSNFIYEHGDASDIKTFASTLTKDPIEIFARYFEPMVRNAEFTRRFGNGKKEALFATMREQGASADDIELADNALKAALGTYGADRSPTLAALSPALADRFSGKKTKAVVQGLQAYQNARLLPFALISSLVDPMGIAIRTGGDFSTAWEGFRTGIKALWNKDNRDELADMLSHLGSADDMAVHELLAGRFGGDGNPTAQKVNEFVFKWNGMATLVRTTRYMALISAHGFLLKHANRADDPKSRRYLAELGLKPGDISAEWTLPTAGTEAKRLVAVLSDTERTEVEAKAAAGDAAAKRRIERDDRVRAALLQFVDEAILRPNSQQTPLWHSDPYMGLVSQYKSFAYAIFDQIGGRVQKELKEGNLSVLLPALAYVPVVIASELLRTLFQYGLEGNPTRDDWTAADYLKQGVDRSGLLGPRYAIGMDTAQDIKHDRLPGTAQLGPSFSQANNILTAFEGRRDLGKEFEAALPASAAWRHWNDEQDKQTFDLPDSSRTGS